MNRQEKVEAMASVIKGLLELNDMYLDVDAYGPNQILLRSVNEDGSINGEVNLSR